MRILETELPEVKLIMLDVFQDPRGKFFESWKQKKYEENFPDIHFVQDNVSFSSQGVIRGLHFQYPHGQSKLITVLKGSVFDVAVDIRCDSENFGKWVGIELSDTSGEQLYIPEGFAHGFQVLSKEVVFSYKCSDYYSPEDEKCLYWDDATLNIDWPITDPVVSKKDAQGQTLDQLSDYELPSISNAI